MLRHEALKEEGLVVQFDESMGKAIFVSHQWLSKEHPDPSMTHLGCVPLALGGLTRILQRRGFPL